MFQRMIRLGALAGLGVALAACAVQPAAPTTSAEPVGVAQPAGRAVAVGEQAQLAVGERVNVSEAGLTINFTQVVEDSRCPANAMCVQQGRAVVAGELSDGAGAPTAYTLTLGGADDAAAELKVGDYTLRAIALDPYPGTVEQVSPEAYRLTLVIEAAGA